MLEGLNKVIKLFGGTTLARQFLIQTLTSHADGGFRLVEHCANSDGRYVQLDQVADV